MPSNYSIKSKKTDLNVLSSEKWKASLLAILTVSHLYNRRQCQSDYLWKSVICNNECKRFWPVKIKIQQDGQIEGEPELYGTTKLTADETWKEWVTVQYASIPRYGSFMKWFVRLNPIELNGISEHQILLFSAF